MKQFWLQVAALLIVIFGGLWISVNPAALNGFLSSNKISGPVAGGGNSQKTIMIISGSGQTKATLNIEVADTAEKRAQGLGGRAALNPNSGMLFIFDKPEIPQFWMKGMKFPLDILWINNDTLLGLAENIPPPEGTTGEVLPIYSPSSSVDKVLEVNAGFAKAHGILVGDKIKQVQ